MEHLIVAIIGALISFVFDHPAQAIPILFVLYVIWSIRKAIAGATQAGKRAAFTPSSPAATPAQPYYESAPPARDQYALQQTADSQGYHPVGDLVSTSTASIQAPTSAASLKLQSQRDAILRQEDQKRAELERQATVDGAAASSQDQPTGWAAVDRRLQAANPKNGTLLSAIILAEILERPHSKRNRSHRP